MQQNISARDLVLQKTICESQLNSFFKHYPLEFIEEKISKLFEAVIPHSSESIDCGSTNLNYLFYEELNLMLKNCEILFNNRDEHMDNYPSQSKLKSVNSIISFIKEVIPISYVFCNCVSVHRTDLIIVMDSHEHKTFDEIYTLLDFAMLGYQNINCTVYTYGTMYDFLLKGHLYFSALCTPENCVYQGPSTLPLPQLDQIKCTELITRSSTLFNQNMHKAITFFNGARQFANESESAIAAFMLQQACELTYRSLLLSLRGKDIKCHDLVVLRKHVSHFAPTILGVFDENEGKEKSMLTSIQEAYINSRYNQSYKINLDELNKSILAANNLMQCAQEIFNYHCQKVKLLAYSSG